MTERTEPDEYEGPEPDPADSEPDFFVTHSCGHQVGYWFKEYDANRQDSQQPCPDCKPCAECGQKLSECGCFHDPFAGM